MVPLAALLWLQLVRLPAARARPELVRPERLRPVSERPKGARIPKPSAASEERRPPRQAPQKPPQRKAHRPRPAPLSPGSGPRRPKHIDDIVGDTKRPAPRPRGESQAAPGPANDDGCDYKTGDGCTHRTQSAILSWKAKSREEISSDCRARTVGQGPEAAGGPAEAHGGAVAPGAHERQGGPGTRLLVGPPGPLELSEPAALGWARVLPCAPAGARPLRGARGAASPEPDLTRARRPPLPHRGQPHRQAARAERAALARGPSLPGAGPRLAGA
ncbi:unnamed protein product [Prorocentrum cordatum]|uniref:Uncharacterized protein n=1 Tax=Prorocentrum cordatum TaxID=2364126 RepID=A0ABN9TGW1_9DINO|nr:unnamed protein product [Polarella glacialis]